MLRSGPDLLRLLLSSLPLFLCAFEDPLLQEGCAQSRSIIANAELCLLSGMSRKCGRANVRFSISSRRES